MYGLLILEFINILFFIFIFKIENRLFNSTYSIKPLKYFIKKGGSLPIKLGQFIINKHKMLYQDNKIPKYIKLLDELLYNVIDKSYYTNDQWIDDYPQLNDYDTFKIINSGSIGSIFLINKNNNNFALKLQHSNVFHKTKKQINIIKYIISFNFIKKFVLIDFNELSNIFLNQFNFIYEAERQIEFYNSFINSNSYIKIPKIHNYSEKKIEMDYINIKFINDPNLKYFQKLRSIIRFQVFLKYMFLEEGLLHLDLHSGNWGIDDDFNLIILDFGYSLKIFDKNNNNSKKIFTDLWYYMVCRDTDNFIRHFITNFIIDKKGYTVDEIFTFFKNYLGEIYLFDSYNNNFYSIIYNLCNKYDLKFCNDIYYVFYYLNYATGIACKYLNIQEPLDNLKKEVDYYESNKLIITYENTVFEEFPFMNKYKYVNDRILNTLKNKADNEINNNV